MIDITNLIIGGCIGFIIFLFELESPSMGGIIFRLNSDGIRQFSPESIFEILKAPLKFKEFWIYKDLLLVNWIFLTIVGMSLALIIELLV